MVFGPTMKKLSRIQKYVPESKNISHDPKYFPEPGVLDSGMFFLDSGKSFRILGIAFLFWESVF